MKFRRALTILTVCVSVLSLIATVCGIFTKNGPGEHEFKTIFGQIVTIYGKGIYGNNTVAAAMQAIPQDIVTLALGIPLLIISLAMARKGGLKGNILLAGSFGYFLITYMMYTFIAMYNRLFLVYVLLMSASLFGFILALLNFDLEKLSLSYNKKLPIRFAGGYLILSASIIGLLWLARVLPTLINGSIPAEVELGTTLTVQAFDLAFFLPGMFISGLLLIKRNVYGFLLAPVSTISNALIMIALLSKGISMQMAGIPDALPLIVMTSLFGLSATASAVMILRNIEKPSLRKMDSLS